MTQSSRQEIMTASKILIILVVVCGLLIGYGESISTGHNSTGWYMIMLFRSVGAIAIMTLFVIWFLSRDNQK